MFKVIQGRLLGTEPYIIIISLDFSKAFDTVRHSTLLHKLAQLHIPYQIYNCLVDFFDNDSHCTVFREELSSLLDINASIIRGQLLDQPRMSSPPETSSPRYTGRCTPSVVLDLQQRLSACIDEVHSWMQTNRLQLNINKSELLWCATALRHQLPRCPFRIRPDTIIPSMAVRDLGIYIDSDLCMQTHVQGSVAGCFVVLRQLCSIWRLVLSTVYQSLVVVLVLSRMDYGNATLSGLPTCLLNRFQSVLNAAARSIAGVRRSEHITDALASFRWLRAPECIKFKLAVIIYRALHGDAPQHLSDQLQDVADLPTRRRGSLRSSTSNLLDVRPS